MDTMVLKTMNNLFPEFGQKSSASIVWNEGQKMFISDEYESESGNRYYKGIRFSHQLVIVEKVGLFHNWTYIDGVEIYVFDGKKPKLVGKEQFDKVYYNSEFIKEKVNELVSSYASSQSKLQGNALSVAQVMEEIKPLVEKCYTSFLSDDYEFDAKMLLPVLESSNKRILNK